VLSQLPAFVDSIAHTSAGTVNEKTGTVTVGATVRAVTVRLLCAGFSELVSLGMNCYGLTTRLKVPPNALMPLPAGTGAPLDAGASCSWLNR
jgi:hypothetical protein